MEIYIKFKNYLLILIASILLNGCATGTGTTTLPTTISKGIVGDKVVLYFSRPKTYAGSGVTAKIIVNGSEGGQLGYGEYVEHSIIPGNFTIKIKASGFHLGMGGDSISGTGSSGDKLFYIVNVKQTFWGMNFEITETTESGFKQSQ